MLQSQFAACLIKARNDMYGPDRTGGAINFFEAR